MSRSIRPSAVTKTKTDTMPEWRRQGYPSYQAWLNANPSKGVTATPSAVTTPSMSNSTSLLDNYKTSNVGQYEKPSTNAPQAVTPNTTPTFGGTQNGDRKTNHAQKESSTEESVSKATPIEIPSGTPQGINGPVPNGSLAQGMQANSSVPNDQLNNYVDEENTIPEEPSEKDKANNYWDEQRRLLLENYGLSQTALDVNKKTSQQNASITYDKLLKYLPNEVEKQGLGGLGISSSLALSANNDYLSRMGKIESDYNANKTELEKGKNEALSSLERYRQEDLAEIEQKEQAEQDEAYNYALKMLESGTVSSTEELNSFVYSLKGKVNDAQYEKLISYGNQLLSAQKNVEHDYIKDTIAEQFYTFLDGGEHKAASNYLEENKSLLNDEEYNIYKSALSSAGYMTDDALTSAKNQLGQYIANGNSEKASSIVSDLSDYLTDEEKANYQSSIARASIRNTTLKWNNDGSWGATPSEWTTLSIKGKEIYRVKYGPKVSDDTLINAAKDIENHSVFVYDGRIYVKKDDDIYEVSERPGWDGHYDRLYEEIFG